MYTKMSRPSNIPDRVVFVSTSLTWVLVRTRSARSPAARLAKNSYGSDSR
jgi:hypothetical protein